MPAKARIQDSPHLIRLVSWIPAIGRMRVFVLIARLRHDTSRA